MSTLYDAIDYPGQAYPRCHPYHLAAWGMLRGLTVADPRRCRVLEIGCGDAANLLSIAHGLPAASCFGLDLAAAPIARGHAIATELGLTNLRLVAADVRDLAEAEGQFDYVIAHGFYSWVPVPVRDALLNKIARHLAPHGIAYVSYNVLPGGLLRRMTRDLMRFHARAASSEADRLAQGLAALRLVRACRLPDESDPARLAFYDEVDTLLSADQRLVYHDDLAEHEQPVYFRDFVNHAGRFGLLHLADAETGLAVRRQEPPAIAAALSSLGGDLEREDYVDFIHVRRFRQSLLCHVAAAPRPVNLAEAAKQLRYYGELQFDSPDASGATRVSNPAGAGMRIDQPWALAVLKRIAAVWPDSATFADLVLGFPAEAVFELLDAAQRMSLIAVKAGTFSFAREVSTKPQVSGLARAMAARGSAVSSRAHFTIDISDAQARRVLVLADGSRDLEAIAAALRSEYPTAGVESVQQTLRRAAGFGLLAA